MTIINDDGSIKGNNIDDAFMDCCVAIKKMFNEKNTSEVVLFRILCGMFFSGEQLEKINNNESLGDNVDLLFNTAFEGVRMIKKYVDEY